MREEVVHEGVVTAVDPQFITVRIISGGACASCHAASLCGMGEWAEKDVKVPARPYVEFEAGESVRVVLKASMGLKAVWISYAVPLAILVTIVLTLLQFGLPELVSALAGVAGVGAYYLVIRLLRDRLADEYVFEIMK